MEIRSLGGGCSGGLENLTGSKTPIAQELGKGTPVMWKNHVGVDQDAASLVTTLLLFSPMLDAFAATP